MDPKDAPDSARVLNQPTRVVQHYPWDEDKIGCSLCTYPTIPGPELVGEMEDLSQPEGEVLKGLMGMTVPRGDGASWLQQW